MNTTSQINLLRTAATGLTFPGVVDFALQGRATAPKRAAKTFGCAVAVSTSNAQP